MLRREFLKLLSFGLPALLLVRPELKEEKSETIKKLDIPISSVPGTWKGTNGTINSVTSWGTTIGRDGKTLYYVYDRPLDNSKITWSVYTKAADWL